MSHANAALTPRARLRLARLIVEQEWPVARAAERYDVSWRDRQPVGHSATGELGSGRHGRPVLAPAPQPEPDSGAGGPQGRAPAVEAAARPGRDRREAGDAGLHRARRAGPVPAQPALPRRPGHRRADPPLRTPSSRVAAARGREEARQRPRRRRLALRRAPAGRPQPGRHPRQAAQQPTATRRWAPRSCTPCIDDHSRVAYAEIHDDETAATATAVLRHAVAWFAARGVTVERVLSDNGTAYRVPPLGRHLRRAGHHRRRRPAPTGPRPTARSNGSTAPWPTAGRSSGSTTPRPPAEPPCQHGSTSTTTTGPTPRSARPRPSPA